MKNVNSWGCEMSKRKIITESLGSESFYDILDGKTPEQVIQRMQELREYHGDHDVYFDVQSYGYDGGLELYLYQRREENDREYNTRVAKEKLERAKKKMAAQSKKDKEYGEYLRLRAKFESEK